eukprot:TRINITY_DN3444_c0_g1_i1.p1 TRINITY_DN3444_c0_g1~~TRINITY_DN3444_c0_g1_i1.p1  ORF type:complete len:398 (-),score=118.14 TRINITY_DN3444_c0_g1_i1:77-1270(-)
MISEKVGRIFGSLIRFRFIPYTPILSFRKNWDFQLSTMSSEKKRRVVLPKPKEVKKTKRITQEITLQAHENYNKKLTDILSDMAMIEKNKGDMARFKAYSKASKALSQHPAKITSGKEAQALDGVGKKIALKIDEILASGRLGKLDKLMESEETRAINLISRVTGIGPVAARKFVMEDGIRTLDDLREKGKLNHHQTVGLKYFDEFESRIPRAEMERLEKAVLDACNQADPTLTCKLVGSYRRGAESSGDIDVMITHPSVTDANKMKSKIIERVVNILRQNGFLTDDLGVGATKYMGVCQLPGNDESTGKPHLHRRIDLKLLPMESFWCGMMHMTGSDFFNVQIRTIAQEKGFTLSEYSLRPIGETGIKGDPLPVNSEEDVFDYLNIPYKPPSERNL